MVPQEVAWGRTLAGGLPAPRTEKRMVQPSVAPGAYCCILPRHRRTRRKNRQNEAVVLDMGEYRLFPNRIVPPIIQDELGNTPMTSRQGSVAEGRTSMPQPQPQPQLHQQPQQPVPATPHVPVGGVWVHPGMDKLHLYQVGRATGGGGGGRGGAGCCRLSGLGRGAQGNRGVGAGAQGHPSNEE